ncbi:MAG: PAS domain-containing protein [Bdellovibrionales bacterium]
MAEPVDYQLALKDSRVGAWVWYLKEDRVVIDEEMAKILGFSSQKREFSSNEWQAYTHPDDIKEHFRRLPDFHNGRIHSIETIRRFLHSNGQWIHMLIRGRPFEYDESGNPIAFTGTQTDVTEHILIKEELKLVIDQLNIGCWKWDLLTGRLLWDEQSVRIFDYEPGELTRTTNDFENRLKPNQKEGVIQRITEVLEKEDSYSEVYEIINRRGETRYIRDLGNVLRDVEGRVVCMYGVVYDVTDELSAHKRLEDQKTF